VVAAAGMGAAAPIGTTGREHLAENACKPLARDGRCLQWSPVMPTGGCRASIAVSNAQMVGQR
jgi:hypothetical protein